MILAESRNATIPVRQTMKIIGMPSEEKFQTGERFAIPIAESKDFSSFPSNKKLRTAPMMPPAIETRMNLNVNCRRSSIVLKPIALKMPVSIISR